MPLRPRPSRVSVSIHAPAKGATFTVSRKKHIKGFQSTRPQRARLFQMIMRERIKSFNPRARKGRDNLWRICAWRKRVSIHAPAKGATHFVHFDISHGVVSIHAPAKGATRERGRPHGYHAGFNPRARKGRDFPPRTRTSTLTGFNPRARKGRDPGETSSGAVGVAVSIHAPAKGATLCVQGAAHSPDGFNPRARKGRDHSRRGGGGYYWMVSIHAPAKGATQINNYIRGVTKCFNPRARKGRDYRERVKEENGKDGFLDCLCFRWVAVIAIASVFLCELIVRRYYIMRGASKSRANFAPMCSTRLRQLEPRK